MAAAIMAQATVVASTAEVKAVAGMAAAIIAAGKAMADAIVLAR